MSDEQNYRPKAHVRIAPLVDMPTLYPHLFRTKQAVRVFLRRHKNDDQLHQALRRISRKLYFNLDEFEAWLDQQKDQ